MTTDEEVAELRKEAVERVMESERRLDRGPEREPQHRECWNCDRRKEYLKDIEEVFVCYTCKHVYYKGVDVTPLQL